MSATLMIRTCCGLYKHSMKREEERGLQPIVSLHYRGSVAIHRSQEKVPFSSEFHVIFGKTHPAPNATF
jgi:hypothetical protein